MPLRFGGSGLFASAYGNFAGWWNHPVTGSGYRWLIGVRFLESSPIGEQAWLDEFSQYQQSPQYKLVNKGMALDESNISFSGSIYIGY